MPNESINKITILFSLAISLISLLVAFLTSDDLFFIITMRFLLVFVISAVLVWTALTTVNSVVVKAAQESIIELNRAAEEEDRLIEEKATEDLSAEDFARAIRKGQNLDLTSMPQEDLNLNLAADSEENPEVKMFEPFKPRRIETDKSE